MQSDSTTNNNLNIRIVSLPSFTVASFRFIGQEPEKSVSDSLTKFINDNKLYEIKSDSRFFGFNHPNPRILKDGKHGYEGWVTIPEDLKVSAPFIKKEYHGGLYAALTIQMPEFHLWDDLAKWVSNNDEYDANYSELGGEIMSGCLEEHLEYVRLAHLNMLNDGFNGKLDLLLPVKKV